MITLYHGSNIRVEEIDLGRCNPYKDFGQAFYLTSDKAQALDVAYAFCTPKAIEKLMPYECK